MKPVVWLGTSLADLKEFPERARRMAGFQLLRVQLGLEPYDWKPMPVVGNGVQEIRLRAGTDHRVLYIATLAEAVYVLHGFEKRTQKTSRRDLRIARRRLSALMSRRPRLVE